MRIRELWDKHRKLISYAVIGGCTTLVSFALLYLLHYIAALEVNLANTLSIVGSVAFAYVCNKLFVFRSRCGSPGGLFKEMASFVSSRAVTILLEIAGVFLLNTVIGLHEMLSKGFMTVVVIILNYVLSDTLVFKPRAEG